MTTALSMLAAMATWLIVVRPRPHTDRLRAYLGPESGDVPPGPRSRVDRRLVVIALAGAVVGALAGISMEGAPPAALAVVGALAGLVVSRAVESTRRDRRALRLRQELPLVADSLAMRVLAGASVSGALTAFSKAASGVAAQEIAAITDHHKSGTSLDEALHVAGATTADPEAARLYELLGHAHQSGGRLAEALSELAADYRAALARDLTAEGGRRALAAYAPILALMVPVTLLFLMYPTLTGLSALSRTP